MPKPKSSRATVGLTVYISPAQSDALVKLENALGDRPGATPTASDLVFSIGLYVLGLDPSGDYSLDELTKALHGKLHAGVYNAVVAAGDEGHGARVDVERAERRKARGFEEEAEEA